MEEEIIEPDEQMIQSFAKLKTLFSDPSNSLFMRVNEKNRLAGLKSGDVVIIHKGEKATSRDIKVYLEQETQRYILTRNEHPLKKYLGRVSWVLKSPDQIDQ